MNDNASPCLANKEHQSLVDDLMTAQMFMQQEETAGRIMPDPLYSTLYGRALLAVVEMSEQLHGTAVVTEPHDGGAS